MLTKPLILHSSARKESDTKKFIELLFRGIEYDYIDLLEHSVDHYSYENNYKTDDSFQKIIDTVLLHKVIVFATPVYWYSMSGLLKVFFDRFTDLITVHKSLGRQLKDKHIFLIAVGADKDLPVGFEVPFQSTCKYLNMLYEGTIYYSTKHVKEENLSNAEKDQFLGNIKKLLL